MEGRHFEDRKFLLVILELNLAKNHGQEPPGASTCAIAIVEDAEREPPPP